MKDKLLELRVYSGLRRQAFTARLGLRQSSGRVLGSESRPIGAAYLKVGEVRDGVDSDLAGWGRGGLSYRGRPGRTI